MGKSKARRSNAATSALRSRKQSPPIYDGPIYHAVEPSAWGIRRGKKNIPELRRIASQQLQNLEGDLATYRYSSDAAAKLVTNMMQAKKEWLLEHPGYPLPKELEAKLEGEGLHKFMELRERELREQELRERAGASTMRDRGTTHDSGRGQGEGVWVESYGLIGGRLYSRSEIIQQILDMPTSDPEESEDEDEDEDEEDDMPPLEAATA
ncbi:hypothetical protein HYDPIDRAFT_104359 [Hydnomerulius pinastri MD-312]|nr:hypothetical protein HYDPIDRAFT_104359 [Hydnomerulius pinastri MD-312]